MSTPIATLIVFSKLPNCKQAKTRLRPSLGDLHVQQLHKGFVRQTLECGSEVAFRRRLAVWYPREELADLSKETPPFDSYTHIGQDGESFGVRLQNAINHGLKDELVGCIVIGTDCPHRTSEILEEARSAVANGRIVIGPSQNGGFYLLGIPSGFSDVDISTCFDHGNERLVVLSRYGTDNPLELPFLRDVDEPEDLKLTSL